MSKTNQNLKSCGIEFFVTFYPEILYYYPRIYKKETQAKERAKVYDTIIAEYGDGWCAKNSLELLSTETWKRNLRAVLNIIREGKVEEALDFITESNPQKVDQWFIDLAKKELKEIRNGTLELPPKYNDAMDI